MSFGSRLKFRREEMGLKQSELGKLLGVSGSAVGNYENEVSSPKADVLYQVFDVLKCDANYLFQDEMSALRENNATPTEMENLVKKYRSLDPRGQATVNAVMEVESAFQKDEPKRPAKMEIKLAPQIESELDQTVYELLCNLTPEGVDGVADMIAKLRATKQPVSFHLRSKDQ